jgi:hypothetical protein
LWGEGVGEYLLMSFGRNKRCKGKREKLGKYVRKVRWRKPELNCNGKSEINAKRAQINAGRKKYNFSRAGKKNEGFFISKNRPLQNKKTTEISQDQLHIDLFVFFSVFFSCFFLFLSGKLLQVHEEVGSRYGTLYYVLL